MRRIAVVGAGVVGQVYAGRLAEAGAAVWLMARGRTYTRLTTAGIHLRHGGVTHTPPVTVVDSPSQVPPVDVAYLAVRADQVSDALPVVAAIDAPLVVTLSNLPEVRQLGTEQTIIGFSGIGGSHSDGVIDYYEIPQQPTMIGKHGGREQPVVDDLRQAGFSVKVEDDPVAWMQTHQVFIAGIGAAILAAGGSAELGRDRAHTAQMVRSVGEGFAALERQGIRVTPAALRTIFTQVPKLFAVPYWQRQLRGELGTLALAPHVLSTRDTEFPIIAQCARQLTNNSPCLDAALTQAGLPRSV